MQLVVFSLFWTIALTATGKIAIETHCKANTILCFTEIWKKNSDELFGEKISHWNPYIYIAERTALTAVLFCGSVVAGGIPRTKQKINHIFCNAVAALNGQIYSCSIRCTSIDTSRHLTDTCVIVGRRLLNIGNIRTSIHHNRLPSKKKKGKKNYVM